MLLFCVFSKEMFLLFTNLLGSIAVMRLSLRSTTESFVLFSKRLRSIQVILLLFKYKYFNSFRHRNNTPWIDVNLLLRKSKTSSCTATQNTCSATVFIALSFRYMNFRFFKSAKSPSSKIVMLLWDMLSLFMSLFKDFGMEFRDALEQVVSRSLQPHLIFGQRVAVVIKRNVKVAATTNCAVSVIITYLF